MSGAGSTMTQITQAEQGDDHTGQPYAVASNPTLTRWVLVSYILG